MSSCKLWDKIPTDSHLEINSCQHCYTSTIMTLPRRTAKGRVTRRHIHSRKYLGTVALLLAEGAALIPQAAAAQTAATMDRLAVPAQSFIFGADCDDDDARWNKAALLSAQESSPF